MSDLRARVRAYCLRHQLLQPGPVVVGVSGGADSLTLLHLLKLLQADFSISLHVATLDHGTRGPESAADAEYVRQTAETWGLPVTVGFVDVPELARVSHLGIEEAARRARYQFLLNTANQIGAATIAVGHNRDDQAETVLMHIVRGTGLTGLRGMLPISPFPVAEAERGQTHPVNLIRPLLPIPRSAIDDYAAEHGLQPHTDTTNADTTYFRNRLRHEVIPYLEAINPALQEALAHTAETTRADYEALQETLHSRFNLSSPKFSRADFLSLPLSFQREVVRRLLPPDVSFDQVERTIAFIQHGRGSEQIAGMTIRLLFDQITFAEAADNFTLNAPFLDDRTLTVPVPGELPLTDRWYLSVRQLLPEDDVLALSSDPLCAVLTLPNNANVALRCRRDGDRFAPQGMNGHTQKLSDVFINMKVPAEWRERVPLLTVNGQIVWLVVPTANGLRSRFVNSVMLQLGSRWVFRYHHV